MQVTGLAFLERSNRLLSCSKDAYLKVWELTTQHCSQTIAGYKYAPLSTTPVACCSPEGNLGCWLRHQLRKY